MTTYVSIDVATKSLALGIYVIDDNANIDSKIVPIEMRVVDLGADKKSKEIPIHEKAVSLKKELTELDKLIPSSNFIVLVEYQMNANYMTNAVFNMIVYHYADRAIVNTVYPSLKNKIWFHPTLTLSNFLANASSNYIANKNHCKYNFMYFMIMFGYETKCKRIAKKNLDDIADTFMQCVAFHYK